MKTRPFGKTGFDISEISLGTWQLGSRWGDPFSEEVAEETLQKTFDLGINALDTADVYQGGMSEKAIGKFNQKKDHKMFVITKVGRKLPKQDKDLYTKENLTNFIDDSRKNLQVDALDMVLLHCPPTDLYDDPYVFNLMDDFKKQGKIKHYGVSIEKIEEGLKATPVLKRLKLFSICLDYVPLKSFLKKQRKIRSVLSFAYHLQVVYSQVSTTRTRHLVLMIIAHSIVKVHPLIKVKHSLVFPLILE